MAVNKISFQGAKGANSEIAIREVYGDTVEAIPCDTFEDAFNSLNQGEADLVPQSGTHIIGEYFLPIRFDLMVLPGVKLEEIKTVYSHVHGLGQCRNIIRENGWKAVVGGDTAGSAKLVSENNDRTIAALAPALAAGIYGLETLAENVEDSENNTTRFVILSREAQWAKPNNEVTQFYADVVGHPEDENLKLAFEELGFYTDEFKILGVYPSAKARG